MMMPDTQKAGFANIPAAGKQFGRPATAREKTDEVREMKKRGMGVTDIARQVGISRSSVYRTF